MPSSILLSESWIVIFPESVYLDGDLNPPPAADVSRKFSVENVIATQTRVRIPLDHHEENLRSSQPNGVSERVGSNFARRGDVDVVRHLGVGVAGAWRPHE